MPTLPKPPPELLSALQSPHIGRKVLRSHVIMLRTEAVQVSECQLRANA